MAGVPLFISDCGGQLGFLFRLRSLEFLPLLWARMLRAFALECGDDFSGCTVNYHVCVEDRHQLPALLTKRVQFFVERCRIDDTTKPALGIEFDRSVLPFGIVQALPLLKTALTHSRS